MLIALLQSGHSVHYIKIGPDNLLYANQGSPGNTGPCPSYGPITLCSIVRMGLDGSNPETYAYGEQPCYGTCVHEPCCLMWEPPSTLCRRYCMLDGVGQSAQVRVQEQPASAGVRNSVGFDWQPGTGAMWATTNARDNLDPDHNNRPDDYLMYLPDGDKNFGFPYVSALGSVDQARPFHSSMSF